MPGFVTFYRRTALLLAGLTLVAGCQPAAPDVTVLPVPLPSLEGLPEVAQQQIRQQHSRTRGAAAETPDAALGQEYGRLGQLLFTYDFLDAADAAFRNASTLRPEDAQWPYYLGVLRRQRGAFEEAIALFEQVLAINPDDDFALLRLAESSLELGRTESAKTHLEAVIAARPNNAFALFLLGQIAYEAGDSETAVAHYETVLRMQPAATQVHAPLGMAYRNLGNAEQSEYHLARRGTALVQLNDPRVLELEAFKQSSGATALSQGQQLIEAGRYQEAKAVLEQALSQNPTNPSIYLSLGVARANGGDHEGAIETFEEALRIDPTESKAHYNIGAIHQAHGRQAMAEERFRAAIAVDAFHRAAHLELAEILRRTGRCQEAVALFERTLEIAPGDIAARQHLALCHLRLDSYTTARTLLEDGLVANPDHLGFIDALARVLAASPEASVRDGARALRLAQDALNRQRRTELLETLAMAHAELGRFDEAISWQNEAIRAVQQLNHAAYLDHLNQNLRRYQQGTPSRTPWPEFMYEQ